MVNQPTNQPTANANIFRTMIVHNHRSDLGCLKFGSEIVHRICENRTQRDLIEKPRLVSRQSAAFERFQPNVLRSGTWRTHEPEVHPARPSEAAPVVAVKVSVFKCSDSFESIWQNCSEREQERLFWKDPSESRRRFYKLLLSEMAL